MCSRGSPQRNSGDDTPAAESPVEMPVSRSSSPSCCERQELHLSILVRSTRPSRSTNVWLGSQKCTRHCSSRPVLASGSSDRWVVIAFGEIEFLRPPPPPPAVQLVRCRGGDWGVKPEG